MVFKTYGINIENEKNQPINKERYLKLTPPKGCLPNAISL